jgi:hypothetical protein
MDEDWKARVHREVTQTCRDMARKKLNDPHLSEENRIYYEEMLARTDRMMAEIDQRPKPRKLPMRLKEKRTRADFDPSLNHGL